MQYTSLFLAALVASGAIAAPFKARTLDNEIRVVLSDQATETGSQTTFSENVREEKAPSGSPGPYQTVELRLGKDVQNKDLRCKVLDNNGQAIVLTRGGNTDITFSDADKGAWTFKKTSLVSSIICSPYFTKIGADASHVVVTLSNPILDLATQTSLAGLEREHKPPVGSAGPYKTIDVKVGALLPKQDLRCQVLDKDRKPITGKRGANVDTTFSDAGKGAWTFLKPSEVREIICDPAFKSANA